MKKTIGVIAAIFLVCIIIVAQNCGGTRIRSYSLNVNQATVSQQLDSLDPASGSSAALDTTSAVGQFFDIRRNNTNTTVYYAEAPSVMGTIDNVLPLAWDALGVAKPAKVYAYFIYANTQSGGVGALLITSGAATTTSTDGTTDPTATTPTSTVQTVIFAAGSNGSGEVGQVVDGNFALWVSSNNMQLVLRSQDVVDDDLASTIQLEIFDADTDSQNLGLLNLVQPAN